MTPEEKHVEAVTSQALRRIWNAVSEFGERELYEMTLDDHFVGIDHKDEVALGEAILDVKHALELMQRELNPTGYWATNRNEPWMDVAKPRRFDDDGNVRAEKPVESVTFSRDVEGNTSVTVEGPGEEPLDFACGRTVESLEPMERSLKAFLGSVPQADGEGGET